ncbi:MAG: metal-sensing transcriptional repressor [Bdellovibrionales bacterium]
MKVKKKKLKLSKESQQIPEIVRVHKIVGQLIGVEKMISEHRPGPQVMQQVQAAISGLTSLKVVILKQYLEECLEESEQTGNNSRFMERALEILRLQLR